MKRCLFCHEIMFRIEGVTMLFLYTHTNKWSFCSACNQQLLRITAEDDMYLCCQETKADNQALCANCHLWQEKYGVKIQNQALFRYNEFATTVLWRIKHNRDIEIAKGFVPFIQQYFLKRYDLSTTIFIPIPSDEQTLIMRGFNLVEYIFHYLGDTITNMKIFKNIEQKAVKQHKKTRNERLTYADTELALYPEQLLVLLNETVCEIVLVDDVFTTGATMVSAISTLRKYTNIKISTFTIFR